MPDADALAVSPPGWRGAVLDLIARRSECPPMAFSSAGCDFDRLGERKLSATDAANPRSRPGDILQVEERRVDRRHARQHAGRNQPATRIRQRPPRRGSAQDRRPCRGSRAPARPAVAYAAAIASAATARAALSTMPAPAGWPGRPRSAAGRGSGDGLAVLGPRAGPGCPAPPSDPRKRVRIGEAGLGVEPADAQGAQRAGRPLPEPPAPRRMVARARVCRPARPHPPGR